MREEVLPRYHKRYRGPEWGTSWWCFDFSISCSRPFLYEVLEEPRTMYWTYWMTKETFPSGLSTFCLQNPERIPTDIVGMKRKSQWASFIWVGRFLRSCWGWSSRWGSRTFSGRQTYALAPLASFLEAAAARRGACGLERTPGSLLEHKLAPLYLGLEATSLKNFTSHYLSIQAESNDT